MLAQEWPVLQALLSVERHNKAVRSHAETADPSVAGVRHHKASSEVHVVHCGYVKALRYLHRSTPGVVTFVQRLQIMLWLRQLDRKKSNEE